MSDARTKLSRIVQALDLVEPGDPELAEIVQALDLDVPAITERMRATVSRASFLTDPAAALAMSEQGPVEVLGEDGELRMTLSSPRLEQAWTRELPTVPGVYWRRTDRGFRIVDVWERVDAVPRLAYRYFGDECAYALEVSGDCEWQGPLTPSEE